MSTEWPKRLVRDVAGERKGHWRVLFDAQRDLYGDGDEFHEVVEVVPSGPVREALEEIVAVATEPVDSMHSRARAMEARGQKMLDIATVALSGLGGVSVTEEEK